MCFGWRAKEENSDTDVEVNGFCFQILRFPILFQWTLGDDNRLLKFAGGLKVLQGSSDFIIATSMSLYDWEIELRSVRCQQNHFTIFQEFVFIYLSYIFEKALYLCEHWEGNVKKQSSSSQVGP